MFCQHFFTRIQFFFFAEGYYLQHTLSGQECKEGKIAEIVPSFSVIFLRAPFLSFPPVFYIIFLLCVERMRCFLRWERSVLTTINTLPCSLRTSASASASSAASCTLNSAASCLTIFTLRACCPASSPTARSACSSSCATMRRSSSRSTRTTLRKTRYAATSASPTMTTACA